EDLAPPDLALRFLSSSSSLSEKEKLQAPRPRVRGSRGTFRPFRWRSRARRARSGASSLRASKRCPPRLTHPLSPSCGTPPQGGSAREERRGREVHGVHQQNHVRENP